VQRDALVFVKAAELVHRTPGPMSATRAAQIALVAEKEVKRRVPADRDRR